MAPKIEFIDRVLARIERLDRQSVQGYLTGLVQERKKLERILDEINEGVLVLNPEGIVKLANRQAFLWLGFQRLFKNRSSVEELTADAAVKEFLMECLKHPFEATSVKIRVLVPREMFLGLLWLPFEFEKEREIILRIENLTDEKKLQDEEIRIQQAEGLLRLAAGVDHEIGNPLNSIQIHTDLLKEETEKLPGAKQESMTKLINVIASETRRLDQIVHSFLKATRQPALRFQMENLNDIFEEVVNFLRVELDRHKVRIKLTLDKNLPAFLLDRDCLHEAFMNLIKNGMEAMPKGGTLTLSTERKEKLCIVRIADQGIGIEEKDLPHIFEAYYTTKPQGFGLGLAQVFQAIRDHGGKIGVKSKLGKGTLFTLFLPLRHERLSLPQPKINKKEGSLS